MAAVRHGAGLISSPSHATTVAGAVARDGVTAARLLLTPADAASAIKGDPGISRRVAWSRPLSLEQVKETAHSHDTTVNDVLMAALSGGLRHYLRDRGVPAREIQALVPFNLRPLDQPVPRDLGNKFGLHGEATAIVTNVPGPTAPVYLAGTPVRTVLIWAPTSGHIGMSVSIFSYRGEVTVGLMVDAGLIPHPDHVVAQLELELEALADLPPRRSRRPPAGGR